MMPPMKILLLNDYAAPIGGGEFLTFSLRDGLRERGHDARLLSTSAALSGTKSGADYECRGTTSSFRTLLQTANPFAARELRRVLGEFRPDLVHVRMFLTQLSPLVLPLLRDVPSLYHVVWHRPICPIGTKLLPDRTTCQVPPGAVCYRAGCVPLRDWGPLMLQLRLWRHWRDVFDVIVANSEALRRRLVAEGIKPVEVVHNGVPVRQPRERLANSPVALFVGRLVPEKGVDVLVRAFRHVMLRRPEARLVIVGEGPEAPALRSLVAELRLGERVQMIGRLSRAEVERRFEDSWVQVVPSLSESFGIVAAEAGMRGTAVVASDVGGLPEIVQHEQSGLLVPPGDAEALAAALVRVLSEPALADRLGTAGRRIALERFTEAAYVDGHLRLYADLISSKGRSA
jgi:glycosyltransferase involved in cell wall biosynthesis